MRFVALLVVVLLAVLGLPIVVLAASSTGVMHEPTSDALEEIPSFYRVLYQDAAALRCPGLPWSVLAGIGKVESSHGSSGGAVLWPDGTVDPPIIGSALDGSAGIRRIVDTDGGRYDGDTVYDRAVGPMQFLPSTWTRYGIDESGDGKADPHNAADAVHAAASYLCDRGADRPDRLRHSLLAYNRSDDYVDTVLFHAARYGMPGAAIIPASPDLITAVLANPRLRIYEGGRRDIAAGRIDARILTILQLASERHTLTVSSLVTGHSRCVGGSDHPGCRASHHWHGRAVDISAVDGRAVSPNNSAARRLAVALADLPIPLRPSEVGTPWPDLAPLVSFFADNDHSDHLHIGMGDMGTR